MGDESIWRVDQQTLLRCVVHTLQIVLLLFPIVLIDLDASGGDRLPTHEHLVPFGQSVPNHRHSFDTPLPSHVDDHPLVDQPRMLESAPASVASLNAPAPAAILGAPPADDWLADVPRPVIRWTVKLTDQTAFPPLTPPPSAVRSDTGATDDPRMNSGGIDL